MRRPLLGEGSKNDEKNFFPFFCEAGPLHRWNRQNYQGLFPVTTGFSPWATHSVNEPS